MRFAFLKVAQRRARGRSRLRCEGLKVGGVPLPTSYREQGLTSASTRGGRPLRVAKRISTCQRSFPRAVAAATAGLKSSDALTERQRRLRRRLWVAAHSRCPPWTTMRTGAAQCAPSCALGAWDRERDRRRVKPQRATSRGVGLKACLVDNRIRRSPTRDSRSSSLVQGTHRLGPGSADIRQLSDIYPANESAAFARNMLIFFDSWLPEVGSNH